MNCCLASNDKWEPGPVLIDFPKSLPALIFVLEPDDELFPSFPLLLELTLNFIFNLEPVEKSFFPNSEEMFLELLGDEADIAFCTLPLPVLLTDDEDFVDELDKLFDFMVIGLPPWPW